MKIELKNNFEFLTIGPPWKQKELLTEEFKSLGFYLSDHPLNEYEEVFNQLKIIPYNKFYEIIKMKELLQVLLCLFKKRKVQKEHHMEL